MHVLSHLHNSTAGLASSRIEHLIPGYSEVLVVVQHTAVVILNLSPAVSGTGLLEEIARIELNARIIGLQHVAAPVPLPQSQVSQTDQWQDSNLSRLVLLTDHHSPRLITVRYDLRCPSPGSSFNPFITETVLPLEEATRPAAELGLGLLVEQSERNDANLRPEYLVSHTHSGLFKVIPLQSGLEQPTSKKGKGKASDANRNSRRASEAGTKIGAEGQVMQAGTSFGVRCVS